MPWAHVGIPSNSLTVFINCIAGQVDFVVPIDTSTALIELHLLKQLRYVAQLLIAGKVLILLYVVDYPLAIVERNGMVIYNKDIWCILILPYIV